MRDLKVAIGTGTIFLQLIPVFYQSLSCLPVSQTLINMFYVFGAAGNALFVLCLGVMKNSGTLVASVPLLIKFHISALNYDGSAFSKSLCQLLQARAVYSGKSGPGNIHQACRFFLFQT